MFGGVPKAEVDVLDRYWKSVNKCDTMKSIAKPSCNAFFFGHGIDLQRTINQSLSQLFGQMGQCIPIAAQK